MVTLYDLSHGSSSISLVTSFQQFLLIFLMALFKFLRVTLYSALQSQVVCSHAQIIFFFWDTLYEEH